MKKLIAGRAVQYQGRMYNQGEQLPAHDGKMVEAWLDAGSAEWSGEDAVESEANATVTTEAQAVDVLRNMGVCITDDDGNFVGAENLAEQIHSLVSESDGNGQSGVQAEQPNMLIGKLDAEELEKSMSREQLNKMATDMGLDISGCKNKGDVAALIAAQPVQAPKDESGGAQ